MKKLVADLSPDEDMLKAVIEKKTVEFVERKEEVHWLWKHFLVSQRWVCGLVGVAESSQRYVSRRNDEGLRARLVEVAREKPRWGYRRLQLKLEEKGMHVNHQRVYRAYREAGLLIGGSEENDWWARAWRVRR